MSLLRVLLVLMIVSLSAACAGSPPVHDSDRTEAPPAPSRSRGKEASQVFLKEALGQYQFVKDPEVVSLVNGIGRDLVAGAGGDPNAFHFLVVKAAVPNAFAIPGGYIFIFDSLLAKLRSPREIAGILAHEIAHVERNHHFKDENKINAATVATLAAMILSGGNPAVVAAGIAANVELQLHYSRENESEADTYAIKYLRSAGYDPASLLESFQTLAFYEQFNSPDMPIYFSTHPGLDERRVHLELIMGQEERRRSYRAIPVDWDRIVVSLQAPTQPVADIPLLIKGLEGEPRSPERSRYLTGVAYLKSGQFARAETEYRAAIAENPDPPDYHADLSLCLLQMKKTGEARSEAETALRGDPRHPAALKVLGRLEEHDGRYPEAVSYLEKARDGQPYDPLVYFQLARAYEKTGDKALQAFNLGKFLRLDLKPEEALREFQRAGGLVTKESEMGMKIEKERVELQRDGL